MQRMIEINIYDIIKKLNEKFQQENRQEYQNKIDTMVKKIDIEYNIRDLKKYIENTLLICYTSYKGSDFIENFDELKFTDEAKLYFLYKVLTEIDDLSHFNNINIHILDYRTAQYEQYLSGVLSIINYSSESEKIAYLEEIAEKLELKENFNLHNNSKNVTNALLSKKGSVTYRVNSSEKISYKFRPMKKNEHRRIICPVCGSGSKKDDELLRRSNKSSFFRAERNSVVYICRHERSKFFNEKPIKISIKEYKKELLSRNIDPIDFVIFNHKILFKR